MGSCSCNPAKEAREVTLMAKAGTQTDFGQRQIILCQQRFGALDAKLDQVLVWSRAGGAFEFTRKMKTAHPRDLGQLS